MKANSTDPSPSVIIPSSLDYENFTVVIYNRNYNMIIIYNCNDDDQYNKTMILTNLALARTVNYSHKVRSQLKHILRL